MSAPPISQSTPCRKAPPLQWGGFTLPHVPGGYSEQSLDLPGRRLTFMRPTDPSALLDDPATVAACEADGDAPYWPHLWPPAPAMAQAVYRAEWPGTARVLEVGCGIGLVGLAAAAAGLGVTVSDNRPQAVTLAVANAAANRLAVEGLTFDWRCPPDRRFDVIIGCEVIYDAALHAPLLATLTAMLAPSGQVWLADHGRMHAPLFAQRAEAAGFRVALVDADDQPLPAFRTAAFQMLKLQRLTGEARL